MRTPFQLDWSSLVPADCGRLAPEDWEDEQGKKGVDKVMRQYAANQVGFTLKFSKCFKIRNGSKSRHVWSDCVSRLRRLRRLAAGFYDRIYDYHWSKSACQP